MSKPLRIAINGFGRIGKMALKVAFEQHRDTVQIVAINDLNSAQQAAQVLQYDSVYGKVAYPVSATDTHLIVDGVEILKLAEKDPSQLPWKDLQIDVVLECTGVFVERDTAALHLQGGARSVIISAPAKGDAPVTTVVLGVNTDQLNHVEQPIVSNASCTTNCIAPVMQVLEQQFGIAKAMMSTIHAYTADQNLVDGNHKDPRRARSAALNIVPTTTGAAIATAETVPSLAHKFDGLSFRVPVPVGSLSDITVLLNQDVTVQQVNQALIDAAASPRYQGILQTTTDPIVSSDIVGNPASSIVDLSLTMVVGGNLVKVVAWYDNEYGYSHRLIEEAIALTTILPSS